MVEPLRSTRARSRDEVDDYLQIAAQELPCADSAAVEIGERLWTLTARLAAESARIDREVRLHRDDGDRLIHLLATAAVGTTRGRTSTGLFH